MQWSDRIGRRLKSRDLHVFLAVAEQGNMAKAAEHLAISRPVVSRTIAGLEHTLGVRLLDRTPRGVEPTMYGRALLKRSLAVFDELRQSVKDIEHLADPSSGELRVGFTEVVAAGLVPAAIERLTKQYRRMTVVTEQGALDTVVESLRDRRCEVAVCRYSSSAPGFTIDPLYNEQLHIVVGARSRWARSRRVSLADLADESWVQAPAEVEPDSPTLQAFRAIGLSGPRVVVMSNSLNLRYGLLASGRFVTMVPGSVLHYGGTGRGKLKVLSIRLPPWHVPTAAVTLKDRTLSPIARLFIDCLHQVAEPLATRT
jgi:DNA-binding transcriptional LysR family regulator